MATRSAESRRLLPRSLVPGLALACGAWLHSCGQAPAFLPRVARRTTAATRLRASAAFADSPKLQYFDGRGVAETARLLFAIKGEAFEDARYPMSFGTPGDFSTMKREEFDADKASGKLDVGMGKVPFLEVGESFRLPQSKAIERYLARKFGMMGSTPEEEAWVDAVAEHVRDISDTYNRKGIFFMKDEEKKAELSKKWLEEELPEFLGKLEKALPGANGFAVGDKISYADVVIFKLLKDTYQQDASSAYAACPKLQSILDTVGKEEGLQKWLKERPKTFF